MRDDEIKFDVLLTFILLTEVGLCYIWERRAFGNLSMAILAFMLWLHRYPYA